MGKCGVGWLKTVREAAARESAAPPPGSNRITVFEEDAGEEFILGE